MNPAVMVVPLLLLTASSFAQVPDNWFPFVISELADDSIANVSSYSPSPAGADGFLQFRDGHFVDAKGSRVRFLATNCTFNGAFPDKDLAPKIAARMRSLGINCVRFHHMDNAYKPRGIWDAAFKDHQHMDAEQVDRLDWFIYQLKLNGIYSNLNLHVSRQFNDADGFTNTTPLNELTKYDKGVDYFQARMVQLQHDYARDLLTHLNPYTKTRYVDEPCIAMVELNNENSLLQFSYGSMLRGLPEPYKGELTGYWNAFLKAKYGSTGKLREAWDEGSAPLGAEMLRDNTFARGTAEWVLESRKRDTDVFEIVTDPQEGRVLHARLNTLGVNPWDFQIHQVGLTLEAGKTYTLSFKIKSNSPRTISVGARWDKEDWRSIGLSETVPADAQWRSYEMTFRARDVNPGHNRISFSCQNLLGDVWLAGVSLKPGGIRGLTPGESLEVASVSLPSPSATAAARRDWFAFIMDVERKYTQGFSEYLKQTLKLHAPVIDTQASYGGIGGVWRESQLDYVDMHAYWQHPSFPGKPWDGSNWFIGNTPMTDAMGRDNLTSLARFRVAGKAFTVSEYNHPAPSDYRAECMPMIAAFAAFQDWDGIFEFDYGTTPTDWSTAKVSGYFQMVTDPTKLAFFPVAANLFRRGDVSVAKEEVRLQVPKSQVLDLVAEHNNDIGGLYTKAGLPRIAALMHKLSVEFTDGGELQATAKWDDKPITGPVISDTEQIMWRCEDGKHNWFIVDTPKSIVILGRVGLEGAKMTLGDVQFEIGKTDTGWAAIALTSMDDKPIAESSKMLLVAMSKCENPGMVWDEQRKTVQNKWGTSPSIAEGFDLTVTLPGGRSLQGFALDGTGKPLAPLAVSGSRVTVVPPYKSAWFGITAR